MAVSTNWGLAFGGCLDLERALLLGVYIKTHDFWKYTHRDIRNSMPSYLKTLWIDRGWTLSLVKNAQTGHEAALPRALWPLPSACNVPPKRDLRVPMRFEFGHPFWESISKGL